MAEPVVHRLEAVEVEDHHRGLGAVPAGGGQRALQPVGEQRPVGEPGQLVPLGEAAQLLDPPLAGDREADGAVEPLDVELLLLQEVHRPGLDRLLLERRVGLLGGQDDRRAAAPARRHADELDPVALRQPVVAQAGVVAALEQEGEAVLEAGRALDDEGRLLGPRQQRLGEQEVLVVALDHQDPQGLARLRCRGVVRQREVVGRAAAERDDRAAGGPRRKIACGRGLGHARPVITTALIGDRFRPLAAGDRDEPVGRRRQPVPGLAAGRYDRLVVRPDARPSWSAAGTPARLRPGSTRASRRATAGA